MPLYDPSTTLLLAVCSTQAAHAKGGVIGRAVHGVLSKVNRNRYITITTNNRNGELFFPLAIPPPLLFIFFANLYHLAKVLHQAHYLLFTGS